MNNSIDKYKLLCLTGYNESQIIEALKNEKRDLNNTNYYVLCDEKVVLHLLLENGLLNTTIFYEKLQKFIETNKQKFSETNYNILNKYCNNVKNKQSIDHVYNLVYVFKTWV